MPGLGQIGLVRSEGFSPWLIRTTTHSAYNHTITYIGNNEVISCETSGVKVLPISHFPNAVWSHFPLDIGEILDILNFSHAQLNKPYDKLMFVWCGVARILRVRNTPQWILRRLASKRAWICSQICDASYQAAGIHLFKDHRAQGAVVPGDFEPIWKAEGWLKTTG